MAKILAIETSGAICSATLISSATVKSKYLDANGNTHDKLLAVFIQRILEDNKLKIDNLDAVALSAGPGSFTGLRIGASIAKALTFNNLPKLIQIPTLNAVAFLGKEIADSNFTKIAATIQSYKDQFYLQYFDLELNQLSEIETGIIDNFTFDKDVYYAGFMKNPNQSKLNKFERSLDSEAIAKIAEIEFEKGNFVNSEEFVPLYVQEFVPKVGKSL